MTYLATSTVNFAQGEMAMFATFVAWGLIQSGVPYWLAFFATLVLSFLGGVVIPRVFLPPPETAPRLSLPPRPLPLLALFHHPARGSLRLPRPPSSSPLSTTTLFLP